MSDVPVKILIKNKCRICTDKIDYPFQVHKTCLKSVKLG